MILIEYIAWYSLYDIELCALVRGCGDPPTGVLDFLFTAGFEILLVALRGLAFSLLILSAPNGTKRLAPLLWWQVSHMHIIAYPMFNPGCKFDWIIKSVPRHWWTPSGCCCALLLWLLPTLALPLPLRVAMGVFLWREQCAMPHSTLQARNRTAQWRDFPSKCGNSPNLPSLLPRSRSTYWILSLPWWTAAGTVTKHAGASKQ